MNKRVLYIGLTYSILVIIYKLIIVLGGYQLTKFGFYYSHILSVFAIIPFMVFAIKQVRDKDLGGVIAGRNAMAVGMTVAAIAMVILSAYQYIEFEWKLKELSIQYYNGAEYLEFLKKNPKIKAEMYPKIIEENIAALSAFKAITAKLFSFLFITVSTAFISAVFMKKN